jgi:hypothetical protein
MAKPLLVLDEVLAMLDVVGVSAPLRDKFRAQANTVLAKRVSRDASDDGTDAISVSSGYGQASQRGFVDLTLNETRSQMDPAKAREVGLMLIEAAEAAVSDEIVMALLRDKIGLDADRVAYVLLDLREIRQGTRGTSWPS